MKKELKTLEEHNSKTRLQQMGTTNGPLPNGIACPECGNELFDSNPMITLTSYPSQKNIHCECGYRGYRIG